MALNLQAPYGGGIILALRDDTLHVNNLETLQTKLSNVKRIYSNRGGDRELEIPQIRHFNREIVRSSINAVNDQRSRFACT